MACLCGHVNAPTNHNPNYDPLFAKEQSRYEFGAAWVSDEDGTLVKSNRVVDFGIIDSPWLLD